MFIAQPLQRCTPESAGISSAQVERFLQKVNHPLTTMNGVMVARAGKVFCEGWWKPFAPDLVHSNHSFGKSYTATAVGIAAGEGLLSLDEPITEAFAEEIGKRGIAITDPRMKRVTVRHLLTMSGGMARMSLISGDWIGHFFRSEMAYEPGEHFQYNSAGSCILGALVELRSGRGLREYLNEKLFRKMGIDGDRFVWLKFQDGHTAEPGTFATTEDNLRLAMLYCQGGRWNGEQLIPEWFVREALSVQIENPYAPEEKDGRCGYGYQLWACSWPGVYRFDGGQGQYGIIWPEKQIVVSIHEGAIAPKGPQATLDAVYEELFRHFADGPLPEDEEACRHLHEAEAALALPTCPANLLPIQQELAGEYDVRPGDASPWFAVAPPHAGNFFLEYQDRSIPAELSRVDLRFTGDACICTFNGNVRIEASWDGTLQRRFAEHTVFPQLGAYAAAARFLSEQELELHILWINGWFATTLHFVWENEEKLRICSDQLRLAAGEDGLKGVSTAARRRKGPSFYLRPGTPDDDNRTYLPEELIRSDIVVNENGNNSIPWPERLVEYTEDITGTGRQNVWYEYVPVSYDPEKKSALVVSFHGGLMTGWGQCCYTSWAYVADREGLIAVFPTASENRFWSVEGILDYGGPKVIEGTPIPRPPEDYRENPDLNFVLALINRMKEKYNIDEERIFMQGMSMGDLMTFQFSRYYGDLLAGAACAGAATWPDALFDKNGTIINRAGPVAMWQARPEHNQFRGDYEREAFSFKMNRYYWLKLNECDPVPQISIVGEDNFAFYCGKQADLVYHDIRNRDHGQKLDEAFLYWDYFFSGLRRKPDGTVVCGDTRLPRKRDAVQAAFAASAPAALLDGEIVPLSQPPVCWKKLKYHGLQGSQEVRGEYLMVPMRTLAQLAGGSYCSADDGLTAEIRLPDGRTVQAARGSIGCRIDDTMRQMYVEAIHRNGELLLSVEWFARYLLNRNVSVNNGAVYVTDHHAELSFFMADLLKDLLNGRYPLEVTEEEICQRVSFIEKGTNGTASDLPQQ